MLENNNIIQTTINFLAGASKSTKEIQEPVAAQLTAPTGIEKSLNENLDGLKFATRFVSNFLLSSRQAIAEERGDIKKTKAISDSVVDGWGTVDAASGAVSSDKKEEVVQASSSKAESSTQSGEAAVEAAVDNVREALAQSTKEGKKEETAGDKALAEAKEQAAKTTWDDLGAVEV